MHRNNTPPVFTPHHRSISASNNSNTPRSNNNIATDPPRQLRISHILLPPDQQQALDDIKTRIHQNPEYFPDLARDLSSCPSRAQGGDIGWISRGRTVKEFEDAAYSIPHIGGISTAATKFGLHLIQLTDERRAIAVGQVTVHDLADILLTQTQNTNTVQLVDVREAWEVDVASLPGFQVFPLSSFDTWGHTIHEVLDCEKETYVLCHHGVRSMQASNFLVEKAGFKKVYNIVGGIDAYARGVDSNVPLY